jgi:aminoglycoside phosphotransferase family enzyme
MGEPTLIAALQDPTRFDHPVERFEVHETHISWVLLTGPFAYKIKKPVNLGFLDFSTLAARRHFCDEELRLNRRLAPQLYRDVVALTGTPDDPIVDGTGEAFEYAVRMVEFPQESLLDHALKDGALDAARVDAIARLVADFHAGAEIAAADSPYGEPDLVFRPVRENFEQIDPPRAAHRAQVQGLDPRRARRPAPGQHAAARRRDRRIRLPRVQPGTALDRRAERPRLPADGSRRARGPVACPPAARRLPGTRW